MADEELRKYLDVLARLVTESGITGRQLESSLGWGSGTVGKLLRGARQDLRIGQILSILKVLDVKPLAFYSLVHAEEPLPSRLLPALAVAELPLPLALPPNLTEEELRRLIRDAVEDALKRRNLGNN